MFKKAPNTDHDPQVKHSGSGKPVYESSFQLQTSLKLKQNRLNPGIIGLFRIL